MYDFCADPRFKDIEPFEKKIWLSSPTMHGDEQHWVDEAILTNWVSTVGENINEVEKQIADYIGCKYAVGLSCGTAALHLAIKLAGEHLYGQPKANEGTLQGKRIFASDMTFVASIQPIVYENGEPIFIDTEYDTWNMDPAALEKAFELYPEVRLVVLAHLYGTPGKMDEIRAIFELREQLVPYLYEEMEKCIKKNMPLITPLFLRDPEYDREADCFMCGEKILVCPVFDKGVSEVNIKLPESQYGFRLRGEGDLIESGKTVTVDCTISDLPVLFEEER